MFETVALGNYSFLRILIQTFPELIWEKDGKGELIFHTAISKRDIRIFSLIHETGLLERVIQDWVDGRTGDNIPHFAAKLPPKDILNSVVGEAFQLRKEVLRFEVTLLNHIYSIIFTYSLNIYLFFCLFFWHISNLIGNLI